MEFRILAHLILNATGLPVFPYYLPSAVVSGNSGRIQCSYHLERRLSNNSFYQITFTEGV